ncbi:MAG: hypothetical protein JXB38_10845 [Anaerolineales bacterium]|nr:hypothetical protein [Anaerolineales bacterium]
MKSKKEISIIIIIALIIVLVAFWLGSILPLNSFWVGFFQNLASDILVALFIGIVVTFYLSKREDIEQREKRKNEILGLLLNELSGNLTEIETNEGKLQGNNWSNWNTLLPGLKDETWKAISEGGEVKWLDAELLGLLNRFTIIYHYISSVKFHEREFNLALMRKKATGAGSEINF